ncbi:MAG: DUF2917 domain-containing protein [Anaeromyxobacteraceae bacterium]
MTAMTRWMRGHGASADGVRELARDATLRLVPGRHGLVVRVGAGSVLVTQAGDPEDHVVTPGRELHLAGRGLAVAWALTPARLEVCRTTATEPCSERGAAIAGA